MGTVDARKPQKIAQMIRRLICNLRKETVPVGIAKDAFDMIDDLAKELLITPPRNCDLFGGNYKMLHTAWWDWTCSPSGTTPDGTVKLTFGEWLLKIVEVRHA